MSESKAKADLAKKQAVPNASSNGAPSASTGNEVKEAVTKLRPGIRLELNHLGKGYLALSLAASAATIAVVQFKKAWDSRGE